MKERYIFPKGILILIVFISWTACSEQIEQAIKIDNPFAGAWKFISLVGKSSDGEVFYPYGEKFYGQLMYDCKGNMSAFLMRPGRPKFTAGDIYKGTPDEIKAAFENFDAYCGTYTIDFEQKTVTHFVEGSRFPNWEGSKQTRNFKFSEKKLILSASLTARGKQWSLEAVLVKK